MAILTELDAEQISRVCASFGVVVRSFEGVLAGSVNTNYEVVTAGGERHFLRVYEEQDADGARRETELVSVLARLGVPTPAPLARTDGTGHTAAVRGKAAALYPFVAGTIRCQKTVSEADTHAVGRALAAVHLAGERLDPSRGLTCPSRFGPEAIRSRLATITERPLSSDAPADEVRAAAIRIERSLDDVLRAPPTAPELPLIHGDLFRDNVLFHASGLALLDFESASIGSASFDLAVTALAWCFGDRLDEGLVTALGRGYRAIRPISSDESADLPRAARLACLRFATTRLTDYELRPRGLGVYKDFRRWLVRLDAVERVRGGLGGLLCA
jgi:homoserine kinase type II